MSLKKHSREFSLSEQLVTAIETVLKNHFGIKLSDSKKIADSVLALSDFYIKSPGLPTPWSQKWCQIAYLAYYLPLNAIRAESVFREARQRKFPIAENLIDFGSGLGSATFSFSDIFSKTSKSHLNIESAPEAQALHRFLIKEYHSSTPQKIEWENLIRRAENNSTAIFSYSLAELKDLPSWTLDCESLVIVEPSTQAVARRLIEIRENLQKKKFYAWAPCTHQEPCPLLHKSKTDWCHDRVHFAAPDWFLEIEKHLPIRNSTLTFSYLLMAKTPPPAMTGLARTTGDLLKEKGKSRQLVCRGPEREFLTWMHKNVAEQEIPRGVLIQWPSEFEAKSNEIRLSTTVEIEP